jgi:hypothetical protein
MISTFCRTNLEIQGIRGLCDEELRVHRAGFRFAYQMCFTVTALGLAFQSIPILAIANAAAFFAMFPPNHPFDYLYNYSLRHLLKRPKVPRRTNQSRFSCAIATVWLAATIFLFSQGWAFAATTFGAVLLIPAGLVGFFDVCIPSMIYNLLLFRRVNPRDLGTS